MAFHDDLQVLGLSPKEKRVLLALRDGANTPLKIARETGVSRPAIYAILLNLHKRGIAIKKTVNGRVHWELENEYDLDHAIYEAKRTLLKISEGSQAVHGLSDSTVIVHRGKEALKKLFLNLFENYRDERFWAFLGDTSAFGWNRVFSVEETNKINRDIKKGHVISETILPEGWFEGQTRELGTRWAKDFEGRTTRVNIIEPKYFAHGAQYWVFKDSLFLMSLTEELVIEIRNSEIQKMILAIFEFMQDNSRVIDANELLRNLIAESKKEKTE